MGGHSVPVSQGGDFLQNDRLLRTTNGPLWVFVINLDRDRDRLARMVVEAERVGILFERFAAVDGNHLEPDLRTQFFSCYGPHEPALTAGEIGCYASHLRIHRLLAEFGQYALVLEDDVRLADDIGDVVRVAIERAPDWDIIRMSNATKSVVLPVLPLGGGRELVRYWTVPNGTGAYLISRSGAIKFVEFVFEAHATDRRGFAPTMAQRPQYLWCPASAGRARRIGLFAHRQHG